MAPHPSRWCDGEVSNEETSGARAKRCAFKCRSGCFKICPWCFPAEERLVDLQAQRFKLEEEKLPPLSLEDVKKLLHLVSQQVESLTLTGSQSSTQALITHSISQYENRKESLNLLIDSLPTNLKQKVVGGSQAVLMPLLTKVLEGAENVQWVGIGLRFMAWTLDNLQSTMQNKEDCIEILKNALDFMQTIVEEVWEKEAIHSDRHSFNPKLQRIIEIAFRCAIISTSNVRSRFLLRFFDAARVKQTMADLKQELRDAKQDALLYITTRRDSSYEDPQVIFATSSDDKGGVDEKIHMAMDILKKDSNDMIALCLHGMPGIGKSFMGLEIFKKFQGITTSLQKAESRVYKTCTVELKLGIEDTGLVEIQKNILGKLCGIDAKNISNCTEGREKLREKINKINAPIFLYLDNVLEGRHLEDVLPLASCFPTGSKLLITSRGTNVKSGVKALGIEKLELMEVKQMEDKEATEFLWRHIGRKEQQEEIVSDSGDLKEKEKEVVKLCAGLPLALKLVGGYIGDDDRGPTNIGVWQDVVEAMEKGEALGGEANNPLHSRLEFSIVSLDDKVRSAFLDIVSFYDTDTTWEIVEHLVGHRHLNILQQRGLVKKEKDPEIREGAGESNLIKIHDIILVLTRKKIDADTQELRIKGMENFEHHMSTGKMRLVVALQYVEVEAFMLQQMPYLRFLQKVRVEGECMEAAQLRHLSVVIELSSEMGNLFDLKECERLKHLSWREGSASSLEFLRHQKVSEQLEVLELSSWMCLEDIAVIQTLRCLKRLTLLDCVRLETLPEGLTSLTGLETLDLGGSAIRCLPDGICALKSLTELHLTGCQSLRCLPESVGGLKRLRNLDMYKCKSLESLPEGLAGMTSLVELSLAWCDRLETLPEGLTSLTGLETLNLGWTTIRCLPDGIGALKSLTELHLKGCQSLRCLPESVGGLKRLRKLVMHRCKSLESLPEGVAGMTSLVELNLACCERLETLPEDLTCLTRLARLDLSLCDQGLGVNVQVLAGSLTGLTYLSLNGCKTLKSLKELTMLTQLRELEVCFCTGLEALPAGFSRLTSLTSLSLEGTTSLSSGLHEIRSLTGSMKALRLANCEALYAVMRDETFCPIVLGMVTIAELSWSRCFPYLPKCLPCFTSLERLDFDGDGVNVQPLILPQQLTSLTALREFTIANCQLVQSFPPDFTSLRSLEVLVWKHCSSLQSLQEIAGMNGLQTLRLTGCTSREHSMLTEIGTLTGLRYLDLSGWENMEVLPDGLTSLRQLRFLVLRGCISLQSLPANLPDTVIIDTDGCTSLKNNGE